MCGLTYPPGPFSLNVLQSNPAGLVFALWLIGIVTVGAVWIDRAGLRHIEAVAERRADRRRLWVSHAVIIGFVALFWHALTYNHALDLWNLRSVLVLNIADKTNSDCVLRSGFSGFASSMESAGDRAYLMATIEYLGAQGSVVIFLLIAAFRRLLAVRRERRAHAATSQI